MSTTAFQTTVQQAYLAYYGRPADPGGLAFWADRLAQNNGNLDAIIDAFANSAEANARFGGKAVAEQITAVYQALFNRNPDAGGLEFYSNGIAQGQFTLQSVALAVLQGARNSDATIISNKLEVARQFTGQLDSQWEQSAFAGPGAANALINLIKNVDATAGSVSNALNSAAQLVNSTVSNWLSDNAGSTNMAGGVLRVSKTLDSALNEFLIESAISAFYRAESTGQGSEIARVTQDGWTAFTLYRGNDTWLSTEVLLSNAQRESIVNTAFDRAGGGNNSGVTNSEGLVGDALQTLSAWLPLNTGDWLLLG